MPSPALPRRARPRRANNYLTSDAPKQSAALHSDETSTGTATRRVAVIVAGSYPRGLVTLRHGIALRLTPLPENQAVAGTALSDSDSLARRSNLVSEPATLWGESPENRVLPRTLAGSVLTPSQRR